MSHPNLLAEWVQKAETDYKSALDLARRRKDPTPDSVCNHCQQCVEKYLKAFLVHHDTEFPRTHILRELNRLCVEIDGSFLLIDDLLERIEPYGSEVRYPGRFTDVKDAREAVATMKAIRKFIRPKLGLK
jgi:HEPN domain-containing protein